MKKDTLRAAVIGALLLIVYHLIAFLIPFVKTGTFWVSYGFTLAAFGVMAVSVYIAFIRKPDAKSRFYGFPVARVGVLYALAQLVLGLITMALGLWIPAWVAVLVFAVGLCAAVAGLISMDAVVEQIHAQDAAIRANVALMRSLQSKMRQIAAQTEDVAVRALAEELQYSDPVSNAALESIEQELSGAVDELQAAVVDGDAAAVSQLCCRTSALLAERNRLCKLNKN